MLAGTSVTYDITVTNNGPSPVTSLRLQDLIPPQFNPATVVFSPASGSYDTGTGEWTGLDLAMGDSVVMQLTGFVPAATPAGTLTNTVHVDLPPDMRDSMPGNNTATDIDNVAGTYPHDHVDADLDPHGDADRSRQAGRNVCRFSPVQWRPVLHRPRLLQHALRPAAGAVQSARRGGHLHEYRRGRARTDAARAAAVLAAIAGIALRRRRRG